MAQTYDLRIDQGATYQLTVTWTDSSGNAINLTGYTARLMIRRRYADQDAGIDPLVSLTHSSGLALGGSAGTIAVTISATTTAGLPVGRWVYDLEVVSGGGVVTRLIQGAAIVSPEVTR